jgi:hypothetical protein
MVSLMESKHKLGDLLYTLYKEKYFLDIFKPAYTEHI